MKKRIISFLLVAVIILIVSPYIRAEILTMKYGEEFKGLEQQTNMMGPASYHKVVKYSETQATVFYVHSGKGGAVINFEKKDNNWEIVTWKMIWSKYGSASEFYWPYYK